MQFISPAMGVYISTCKHIDPSCKIPTEAQISRLPKIAYEVVDAARLDCEETRSPIGGLFVLFRGVRGRMKTESDRLVSIGELSRRIGASPSWVRKLEASGRIPQALRLQDGTRVWREAELTDLPISRSRKQLATSVAV